MILRARVVYPVTGPAIADGAVVMAGRFIKAVGAWKDLKQTGRHVLDLGDTVLLPGLVNAHCHLDYTNMVGQLPPPKVFTDWLKLITETKSGWDRSDYEASWETGARMLVNSGTGTVADIEAVPELLPLAWEATPLRVFSFLEMIGITQRRPAAQILDQAIRKVHSLPGGARSAGLSPHAPYSTLPALLRLTSRATLRHRLWVCIHVAESSLEFDMFQSASGPMYEWLRRSTRDMSDCGLGSPVQHLNRCGLLGKRVLAAHVNYLGKGDAELLGESGTHVVHCPRSHDYFGHQEFPLRQLRRAGVNICLGTDSLASVYKTRREKVELNMFDEMRVLAKAHSYLRPETILEMATVNGAKALGLARKTGELGQGAFADVIAIPYAGPARGAAAAVLAHKGPVFGSLIGGRWAVPPGGPGTAVRSRWPAEPQELRSPAMPGGRRTSPA